MSKRKISEVDASVEPTDSKSQKHYHSLDSDDEEEEDETLKYALKDEDIEGQEEGGAGVDEGVQLTPFNMKEEMEEGHFDKDGMYHWKKEKFIKDNWLDNIDWVKIRESENDKQAEKRDSEDEDATVDITTTYKKILLYLQPKESISKALKRLGGKRSLSASERLKLKKAGLLEKALAEEDNSHKVTELTELANSVLTFTGNMDVYQETYEIIKRRVDGSSAKEAVLDMYADDFEIKEKERLNDNPSASTIAEPTVDTLEVEVMWELKRGKDEKMEGPFTTRQMDRWAQGGDLKAGSLVRKCGTTEFYSSSRIDFELYL